MARRPRWPWRAGPHGWLCRLCGGGLGDGEDWHEAAHAHDAVAADRLATMGIRVRPTPACVREHLCPTCGFALDVRVEITS